jgi:hypothetical protein
MKTNPVFKSLAARSPEVLGPEPERPAQGNPEPRPADAKTQRENHLYITVLEHSGFVGCRHWGLNEW